MHANSDSVLVSGYWNLVKDYEFQVVAYGESAGIVEIRYYEGDVEAFKIDDWYETELEQTGTGPEMTSIEKNLAYPMRVRTTDWVSDTRNVRDLVRGTRPLYLHFSWEL